MATLRFGIPSSLNNEGQTPMLQLLLLATAPESEESVPQGFKGSARRIPLAVPRTQS